MNAKTLTLTGSGKPIAPPAPVVVTAEMIAAVTPERTVEAVEQLAWEASRRAAQPGNPSAAYDRSELVALLAVLSLLTGRAPDDLAREYASTTPTAARGEAA